MFIALSRFQATTKASNSRAVSIYEMQEQNKEKIEDDVFWRKFHDREYTILKEKKNIYVYTYIYI